MLAETTCTSGVAAISASIDRQPVVVRRIKRSARRFTAAADREFGRQQAGVGNWFKSEQRHCRF